MQKINVPAGKFPSPRGDELFLLPYVRKEDTRMFPSPRGDELFLCLAFNAK